MTQYQAYHGASLAEHQGKVSQLGDSWRMTCLTIAGSPRAPVFGAVWSDAPGPKQRHFIAGSEGDLNNQINSFRQDHFLPVLLDATGPDQSAMFTAVFEYLPDESAYARTGLEWGSDEDPRSLLGEMAYAGAHDFIPVCIASYGEPRAVRYAGVWMFTKPRRDLPTHLVDPAPAWSWGVFNPSDYPWVFEAIIKGGDRVVWSTTLPDENQLVVWRDTRLGDWVSRHHMDAAAYQIEFDLQKAKLRPPTSLQATNIASGIAYSAVFDAGRLPVARVFSATGLHDPLLTDLDDIVRAPMREAGIRACAIAAVKGGDIKVLRGYTWAEPGYPQTMPQTPFRLASLSKIYTCAALDALEAAGALNLDRFAFPLLGVTKPLQPGKIADPRMNQITIRQLADHTSGLERGIDHYAVAEAGSISLAPSREDLIAFAYGADLRWDPGAVPAGEDGYSNFAYVVLTSIIEMAAGRPYLDYIHDAVLKPLGLGDLWVGRTDKTSVRLDEPPYHGVGVGRSNFICGAPHAWEPAAYGGSFLLENSEGAGGLVSTALTVARTIAAHYVSGRGPRGQNWRWGGLAGTATLAGSIDKGIDLAILTNRTLPDYHYKALAKAVEDYLVSKL